MNLIQLPVELSCLLCLHFPLFFIWDSMYDWHMRVAGILGSQEFFSVVKFYLSVCFFFGQVLPVLFPLNAL